MRGNYRPSRQGPKPHAQADFDNRAAQLAAARAPSPKEQAAREKEIIEQLRRIKGEPTPVKTVREG